MLELTNETAAPVSKRGLNLLLPMLIMHEFGFSVEFMSK
jgi:hypothetical protein